VDRFNAVAFEKFRQRTFDAALTSALCAISVEDDLCSDARITISAATPAPRPCLVTAGNLIGVEVTAIDVDAVAAAAADEALTDPTSLPDQYRHELAVTLTRRALTRALGHRS
jgi:carbon-monoxide dehydrogenase medium subunit